LLQEAFTELTGSLVDTHALAKHDSRITVLDPADTQGAITMWNCLGLMTLGMVLPGFMILSAFVVPYLLGPRFQQGAPCVVFVVAMVIGAFAVFRCWPYLNYFVWSRAARRRIDQRPEIAVSPDDSEAHFVKLVPRANWSVMMIEDATEIGYLKIDTETGFLLFEGDKQRWMFPLTDLQARIESYRESAKGNPMTQQYLILQADIRGQTWEAPLRAVWKSWNWRENDKFVRAVIQAIWRQQVLLCADEVSVHEQPELNSCVR
jgi:hypothetical protein